MAYGRLIESDVLLEGVHFVVEIGDELCHFIAQLRLYELLMSHYEGGEVELKLPDIFLDGGVEMHLLRLQGLELLQNGGDGLLEVGLWGSVYINNYSWRV